MMDPLLSKKSLWSYALVRLLDVPFWALHALIPVILYKELGASPFQIACLVTLKPLLSLVSMYWGASVGGRPDRLVKNIRLARMLAYLPFFLFPFVTTPWFFIVAYGVYMMLQLGTVPAWMEILNRHVAKAKRERIFSFIQAFCYMGAGFLPFLIGGVMDNYNEAWRWLFPVAAVIGISSDWIFRSIPVPAAQNVSAKGLAHSIKKPWKESFAILKDRSDFTKYQIGFMFVGAGLMVMQPALPIFFTDVLKLSYTELSVAITLSKGLGFALASPWFGARLNRSDIFLFSGVIAFFAGLFPLLLLSSEIHLVWLYIAYFFYGMAQAGQELTWNMSGPLFAGSEDSTPYTNINLMAIGLRGAIIPFLGSAVLAFTSPSIPLVFGASVCLMGAARLYTYRKTPITT